MCLNYAMNIQQHIAIFGDICNICECRQCKMWTLLLGRKNASTCILSECHLWFGHSIWVILKKKIKKFYKSWSCYVSKHRLTGKSFANECAVSQSGPPSDFTGFLLILRHQNGTSETSDLRHSSQRHLLYSMILIRRLAIFHC